MIILSASAGHATQRGEYTATKHGVIISHSADDDFSFPARSVVIRRSIVSCNKRGVTSLEARPQGQNRKYSGIHDAHVSVSQSRSRSWR